MKRFVPLLLIAACGGTEPAPSPMSVDDCGFHEGLAEPFHYIRYDNQERGVEVLIVREYIGPAGGRSSLFELRAFALSLSGEVECHSTGLEYENSHHNWSDRARVHRAEGTLELKSELADGEVFELTGPGFDPVPLRLVEGEPGSFPF